MISTPYPQRLKRCGQLMKTTGLDLLLLTKPANMFYLTDDGRLCAYAMITQDGRVALGVPKTDVEDVNQLAHFDHVVGFEDEVGMIDSIAHHFERLGLQPRCGWGWNHFPHPVHDGHVHPPPRQAGEGRGQGLHAYHVRGGASSRTTKKWRASGPRRR